MNPVTDISDLKAQQEAKIRSYDIKDLILDPIKRKEADDYYMSNYEYIEEDDFAKRVFGRKKCFREFLRHFFNVMNPQKFVSNLLVTENKYT